MRNINRVPREERRPNPRSNRGYSQEELDRMGTEMQAHQAYLDEAYQEARLERVAREYEAREAWREERRQARVQEWAEQTGRSVVDYPWGGISR